MKKKTTKKVSKKLQPTPIEPPKQVLEAKLAQNEILLIKNIELQRQYLKSELDKVDLEEIITGDRISARIGGNIQNFDIDLKTGICKRKE